MLMSSSLSSQTARLSSKHTACNVQQAVCKPIAKLASHHTQHQNSQSSQRSLAVASPIRSPYSNRSVSCRAAAAEASAQGDLPTVPSTENGKLISKTEVASFIQRDDMMDQLYRWAIIEAGEGGLRNFGLPMTVEPFYHTVRDEQMLWGYRVSIFKEGDHLCDLGVMFDQEEVSKHEWVGRGDDGFPVLEGKVQDVVGKHLTIWKLDAKPVDETLRSAIRAFCTGFVTALNRYYAFGSVFKDDSQ